MRSHPLMPAICLATAMTLAALPSQADTVCSKYEFGEPGDLKKCLAEQEADKAFIWQWLAQFGTKSPLQLEMAVQKGCLFALLANQCMREANGAVKDLNPAIWCLKSQEKSEKAAGTDLSACAR